MSEQIKPPVVVAVGHDPVDAALTFAAAEAARAKCGLRLVHVVHHLAAKGPRRRSRTPTVSRTSPIPPSPRRARMPGD